MKDTPIFTIETTMEKRDYRKFLYIATFRRSPIVLPLVALISLLGAVIILWVNQSLTPTMAFLMWVLLFFLSIGTICFRVERKNKQRISTDNTGTFGSTTILKFYPDRLMTETPATSGTNTLEYNRFYQLLECEEYFIFYYNSNMASLLRKKDIKDKEKFRLFIAEKFAGKCKKI